MAKCASEGNPSASNTKTVKRERLRFRRIETALIATSPRRNSLVARPRDDIAFSGERAERSESAATRG